MRAHFCLQNLRRQARTSAAALGEEVVAKTAGDLRELDPGKRDAAWTRCAARNGLRFCNIAR